MFRVFLALFYTCGLVLAQETAEVTAAESVALDFLEARGAWDSEALLVTLADELDSRDIAATKDDYADALKYYETINWNWTADSCEQKNPGNVSTSVSCKAQLENDWTRALGIGPFNMVFDFHIDNESNQIIGVYPQWNRVFIQEGLQVFFAFLNENHPDDFETLFGSGQHFLPRGEEKLVLLRQRTDEFAAAQR